MVSPLPPLKLNLQPTYAYNTRFDTSSMCTLGKYDVGNERSMAYRPGPLRAYFRHRLSAQGCFAEFVGGASWDMLGEFCPRAIPGGRKAVLRTQLHFDDIVSFDKASVL